MVGHNALHVERAFEHDNQVIGCNSLRQFADDTLATFNAVDRLLFAEEAQPIEPHLLRNLIVDPSACTVHIGVHGDDADMVLYGFHHRALHTVLASDMAELMEYQRMVRHNEVTAQGNSLINDGLGNVKTQ